MKKMTKLAVLLTVFVGASLVSVEASAWIKHRVPLASNYATEGGISSWFDHNPTTGVFLRYDNTTRGGRDKHSGIDFPVLGGIWASANGKVVYRFDGCPEDGSFPSCGGNLGNHVRVLHANWMVSVYGHMKKGSVAVADQLQVLCGRLLGNTGNSGESSSTHLHFVLWSDQNGTQRIDPFGGPASNQGFSHWVNQNAFGVGYPGTTCQA